MFGGGVDYYTAILTRCYKRKYCSQHLNIYSLLEKSDRTIFSKISSSSYNHPLRSFLPVAKESSFRLRTVIKIFRQGLFHKTE